MDIKTIAVNIRVEVPGNTVWKDMAFAFEEHTVHFNKICNDKHGRGIVWHDISLEQAEIGDKR